MSSGDADAAIAHRDHDPVRRRRVAEMTHRRAGPARGASSTALARVGEDVDQRGAQAFGVGDDRRHLRIEVELHGGVVSPAHAAPTRRGRCR